MYLQFPNTHGTEWGLSKKWRHVCIVCIWWHIFYKVTECVGGFIQQIMIELNQSQNCHIDRNAWKWNAIFLAIADFATQLTLKWIWLANYTFSTHIWSLIILLLSAIVRSFYRYGFVEDAIIDLYFISSSKKSHNYAHWIKYSSELRVVLSQRCVV